MAELDVAGMSDEQLLALANSAVDEAPDLAGEQADAAGAEGEHNAEPPADQQEQQQAEGPTEQQQGDDWNPEGPGNIKVALQQARGETKAEREAREAAERERDQYRQRLAQYEQQQMQAQYQADEQARLAQRTQMLEDAAFDPDRTAQLLSQFAAEDRQYVSNQANEALAQMRWEEGYSLARETLPDFEAVIAKAMADPETAALVRASGSDAIERWKSGDRTAPNPVIAAYKMAKRLDPDARKAEIAAEVAKQVQAVLQKQNPPETQGHKGISHVTSGIPAGDKPLPVSKRSTEDLMREAGFIR